MGLFEPEAESEMVVEAVLPALPSGPALPTLTFLKRKYYRFCGIYFIVCTLKYVLVWCSGKLLIIRPVLLMCLGSILATATFFPHT